MDMQALDGQVSMSTALACSAVVVRAYAAQKLTAFRQASLSGKFKMVRLLAALGAGTHDSVGDVLLLLTKRVLLVFAPWRRTYYRGCRRTTLIMHHR